MRTTKTLTIVHKNKNMIYEITIGIEAQSEQQATEIAKALVEIKNKLSDNDIKDLAKILKSNPSIVKTAKKLLG